VTQAGGGTGDIVLTLGLNKQTEFIIANQGSSQSIAEVKARNFTLFGSQSRTSKLNLWWQSNLTLTGSINSVGHQFDIEASGGTITAANAYLLGDATVGSNARLSTISLTSEKWTVNDAGITRVGGAGKVQFTATNSTMKTGDLNIDTTSAMTITGGSVDVAGKVDIGASSTQTPTISTGVGAKLKLESGAVFNANTANKGIVKIHSEWSASFMIIGGGKSHDMATACVEW
jgi:hypothetical protein